MKDKILFVDHVISQLDAGNHIDGYHLYTFSSLRDRKNALANWKVSVKTIIRPFGKNRHDIRLFRGGFRHGYEGTELELTKDEASRLKEAVFRAEARRQKRYKDEAERLRWWP